ncbi:uncharacterized protein YndB with AHSA1/START domain [Peribacillus deserti]|uniref:Uncharacterized protein YndB with AHSA1/START domain n=1 Tax=Peribacillus deserti TaxID=673318 RepID=A0ABS2QE64_9BACI|nr:SRPBCC family protein [Peribacillus deserti]MBM7691457.1 uncharacterized protein YndB with AHSA1/START domain [Peribacillus deserti]
MLAVIEKFEDEYVARFERHFSQTADHVWAAITTNESLEKWMPNLEMKDLRKGGVILFNMNDGTGSSFILKITNCQSNSLLEFEWGDTLVRFELFPAPEGCLLVLKEFIPILVDHTSKDLAGWHVCLERLNAVLNGSYLDFQKVEWELWHQKYRDAVNGLQK